MLDLDQVLQDQDEEEETSFLHVRMPAQLYDDLKLVAERRSITVSKLIRALVNKTVEAELGAAQGGGQ